MLKENPPSPPGFREALRFWFKLGWISFGGPTGQIAIMHEELVERRRWISEERFFHALNYCMLLPGPEAQQLAIYTGWLLNKTRGGVVAGVLFVLPSMLILWGLSVIYVTYGNLPLIGAVFYGLKPAVIAIVIAAVIRIGRRALKNVAMWALALAAFLAINRYGVPFPLIVAGAALIGLVGGNFRPQWFRTAAHGPAAPVAEEMPAHTRPSAVSAFKTAATCIGLWALPLALIGWRAGSGHTLFREAVFFSKAAMVTFGGAYAVLPYVSQQAVQTHGWLNATQMLDGLGLAETTPGPLIMVLQFVGFMGGWNHPGTLPPLLCATLGALVTTWMTFVPCFLWVLLGAPYIELLRGNVRMTNALSTVTASVVGVILNLAVWFGLDVIVPAPGRIDWFALSIAAAALLAILRFGRGVVEVIVGAGIAGVVWSAPVLWRFE